MAANASHAPPVVEEGDGLVTVAAFPNEIIIGGHHGTVKVSKVMRIEGDLTVGKDLIAMGKVIVSGAIELAGGEWVPAGGVKPNHGPPIDNGQAHIMAPPAFAARNHHFLEGLKMGSATRIVEDLVTDGDLYVTGRLLVNGEAHIRDLDEVKQG